MTDQKSVTALMSAFGRAYHFEHEAHPVFRDSLARELFSDGEYAFIRGCLLEGRDFFGPDAHESDEELLRELVNVFIAPTPLCRSAYCENALLTAEKTGTEQYVMLGAGLDSFAFRNTRFASRHMIYEADHPASQADKLMRVKRAGWTVPDNLRFVPVDFAADDLAEKLSEAGFNPSRKTFFSWLGVSYYLTRDQIEKMLWGLSALCRGGGTVLFDYADQGLFSAQEKRVQNMIALAAAGAEPMRSCFSEPELERLLEEQGFLIYEALSPKDIQTQIIDPSGCAMTAFEHIHYVQAVKKPGTD